MSGTLEVVSRDLGLTVYDLQLEALDPLPEHPVKFQTSIGQTDSATVTIQNLSRSRAEFICKVCVSIMHSAQSPKILYR